MADKNLWSNYTEKDTLTDKDEVMVYDSEGKTNKRSLMEKFWDYVVEKMATAVISKLETENKTVIGALNYLNGNTVNLISVLLKNAEILQTSFNYNELKSTGTYYLSGTRPMLSDNRPNDECTNCYLLIFAYSATRVTQIVFPGNYKYISYRSLNTDSNNWNEWKTVK